MILPSAPSFSLGTILSLITRLLHAQPSCGRDAAATCPLRDPLPPTKSELELLMHKAAKILARQMSFAGWAGWCPRWSWRTSRVANVEGLLVCAEHPRSPTVYACLDFWLAWLPGSKGTFTDTAAGALAGQISNPRHVPVSQGLCPNAPGKRPLAELTKLDGTREGASYRPYPQATPSHCMARSTVAPFHPFGSSTLPTRCDQQRQMQRYSLIAAIVHNLTSQCAFNFSTCSGILRLAAAGPP